MTVEPAMDDLVQEGLITCVDRKGAFLVRQLAPAARELHTIGLLCAFSRPSPVAQPYRSEILRGLLDKADALKADFPIFSYRSEQGHIQPTDVVRECDGVVVLGAIHPGVLASFVKEHVPMVVVDYASDALPLHHLVCDNEAMVRSSVARLLADRHDPILYVYTQDPSQPEFWTATDSDHIERRNRFETVAHEHGAQWPMVQIPCTEHGIDLAPLVDALAGKNRPTGMVVERTGLAHQLLRELETQTRLCVPRDL